MTSIARRVTWQNLEREVFDLLVIGGGITGAGIARDAALRGLKVALVEKNDFAAGTSSKSSKLIHGGLRYLQQAELSLVFEAVSERTRLLKLAPHLVRPQRFLVPAYRGKFPGRMALNAGLLMYDALSRFSAPGRHRTYRKKALLAKEPGLRDERLTGGVTYYDSITDDARLTIENILDAKRHGAQILSYARVTGFIEGKTEGNESLISGVTVQGVIDPEQSAQVRAKVTINATGPWSDLVLRLLQRDQPAPLLRPTKGAHVVLDAARLPVTHAVVMTTPQDERVMFAIPWTDPDQPAASRTILGTTDTDYHGDPDRVAADAADVEYLLTAANFYFPTAKLQPADVLATWAGLRPLVMPDAEGLSASSVSREHRILSRPGLITIVGGKLTTYRRMAEQLLDAAYQQLGVPVPECPTSDRPLPGAEGLLAEKDGIEPVESVVMALLATELPAELPALDRQVAVNLAHTYGARALRLLERVQSHQIPAVTTAAGTSVATERLDPELPYIYAEVDLAVTEDAAERLEDVLGRRLPLLLRARDQGLFCAAKVAARMAALLDWTPAQTAAELAHYQDVVALSRLFRTRA
ncbi:MAG TPA: glycerol-3-phosphate dehydrogenase/oxidase [Pseudomonadota bacterium]|nr:glycerol-3-phosphate dehydrogenase/oxidase [Pseudomonadota bacterium]